MLAEREGFEPPIPFRVCRFSRPVPSTTRPPLRLLQFYYRGRILRKFPTTFDFVSLGYSLGVLSSRGFQDRSALLPGQCRPGGASRGRPSEVQHQLKLDVLRQDQVIPLPRQSLITTPATIAVRSCDWRLAASR